MKTALALSLAILTVALSCSAVLAQQTLRVGVDTNYPPFSNMDENGRPFGLNVDMIGLVCQGLKQECRIVPLSLQDLLVALEKKDIDFAVASLAKTPDRERFADFTDCYYKSRSVFIGPARLAGLDNMSREGMAGRRMSAKAGSVQFSHLEDNFAPEAHLVDCGDIDGLKTCLLEDRAEIVLVESLVAYSFLQSGQGGDFDFIGQPLDAGHMSSSAHIAVAKGQKRLLRDINKVLARIKLEPAYDNLFIKYFGYSAQ